LIQIDDAELQDEPLQIRLMDYDTYSANDAIGKVYLDLNPLLMPPALLGRGNVWSESVTVPPSGTIYSNSLMNYFSQDFFVFVFVLLFFLLFFLVQEELFYLDGSLFLTQCME